MDVMLLRMGPSGLRMANRLTLLVYRMKRATAGRMIVQPSGMDEGPRGMQQEALILPDYRRSAHAVRPGESLMAQDPITGWILRAGRYGRTGSGTAAGVTTGAGASGSRRVHVDGRLVLDVLQSIVPVAAGPPRFRPELLMATLQGHAGLAGMKAAENGLAISRVSLPGFQGGRIGLVMLREGMQGIPQGDGPLIPPGASHGVVRRRGFSFLDAARLQAVGLDTTRMAPDEQ